MCDKCKPKYQSHLHTRLALAVTRAKEDLEVAEIALKAYEAEHTAAIEVKLNGLRARYGK